ncbi:MAG: response regulator, partial [Planctomycetota bacterium]|nr:response regulator [Planctomycetota bacterium]
ARFRAEEELRKANRELGAANAHLQHSLERFELLAETAGKLLQAPEPQTVVESLCRGVMEHLDCHAFFNFVADPEKGRLHLNAYAGVPAENAKKIEWLDFGVAVCGCAAQQGARIVVEDIQNSLDARAALVKPFGITAYACHPLKAQERVIGTLSFGTRSRTRFSEDDLSLMHSVADLVAIAMDRLQGVEALRRSEEALRQQNEELGVAEEELRTQNEELAAAKDELSTQNEAVRENAAFTRSVLDGLFAFVGVTTPDGTVIETNRRSLEATGLKPEDVIGKPFEQAYCWAYSPDAQAQLRAAIERGARGQSSRYDAVIRVGEGRFTTLDFMLTPLRDAEGRVTHLIPSGVDISERKAAEEQLRQLTRTLDDRVAARTTEAVQRTEQLRALALELTQAEQRERRRLAKVLHDHLQQLLVGAKFGVGALRGQMKTKAQQQIIQQLGEILDEAIKAARSLTAELSPPVLHEKGLAAGLEWLARQMLEKHRLTVEVAVAPDGDVEPKSEQVRLFLYEATRELLFNVVKHAGINRAFVSLSRLGADRVAVTVSDTGAGFDVASMTEGGFGLFSIRERLQYLGGKMEVESAPGHGSRFTLVAPILLAMPTGLAPVAAPAAGPPAQAAAPRPRKGASCSCSTGDAIRVLLADDHPVMRQGLARLLQEHDDIEVVGEAGNGREAVELAGQLRPDVILMDISMPGLNGIEATRLICGQLPQIRVIGLSMHEEADMAAGMRQAGAAAYLTKGGSTDELIAAIRAGRRA